MATFDDVTTIGGQLPEVSVATSYGTPALHVRSKSFCRMWSEREHDRDDVHDSEVLVVFCEPEVKPVLLEAHAAVFTTAHYDGYGAVLVRLADVEPDLLAELLEESYRLKAPKALVRRLDGED